MIKSKKYTNVFAQAMAHPQAEQFSQESKARLYLAVALHKARSNRGFSMAQLAKKAGTTPAMISRIENRQVSAGIDMVYRLFKALGEKKLTLEFE